MKLRSGDNVVVVTGKDKGKTGRILKMLNNGRIVVSDINMRTKHVKSQPNRPGQILKYEASMDASNVMLVDSKSKKRTRIGYEVSDKGKKRIAKRSGEAVVAGKVPDKQSTIDNQQSTSKKKEEKELKEKKGKDKKAKKAERVSAPEKKAFWKGLKFGAEAMEESEEKDSSGSGKERPAPDQGKTPDTFTHKRGE